MGPTDTECGGKQCRVFDGCATWQAADVPRGQHRARPHPEEAVGSATCPAESSEPPSIEAHFQNSGGVWRGGRKEENALHDDRLRL